MMINKTFTTMVPTLHQNGRVSVEFKSYTVATFVDEDEDEVEVENDYDGPNICVSCNGSGEGRYDGTRCSVCGGSGMIDNEEEV